MPLLHWLTRDADMQTAAAVPTRLLEEAPELSFAAPGGGPALAAGGENLLVQGDNLDALKALLPFYAGQVKCIYIDPPYNTKSAFEHYDDNLEHSTWLAMMVPRLQLLREFLREDGSIWVSIDDNEGHYLKVLMDEIFGRKNFWATFVWERDAGGRGDASVSVSHDFILSYGRNAELLKKSRNLLPRSDTQKDRFRNPDNDPRGPWRQGDDGTAKSGTEKQRFPIELPSGRVVRPKQGRYWAFSEKTFNLARQEGRAYFGKKGDSLPIIKRYLDIARDGVAPRTWWSKDDGGTNQSAKRDHLRKILPDIDVFDTPKPEQLIHRILTIATNPGDLVMDSFLGSGTTAAVAHKMGRRWIGIEMGDHARTHCALRLRKVIEGEQGGVSETCGWQGGGSFRFCTLGAPIFAEDGRVSEGVSWAALAAHVWFAETNAPLAADRPAGPFIGVDAPPPAREAPAGAEAAEGAPPPAPVPARGVALLFNGVLKDRSVQGGNVLTRETLRIIREDAARAAPGFDGPLVVYAAACRLAPRTLEAERILFRQTPYDISARA